MSSYYVPSMMISRETWNTLTMNPLQKKNRVELCSGKLIVERSLGWREITDRIVDGRSDVLSTSWVTSTPGVRYAKLLFHFNFMFYLLVIELLDDLLYSSCKLGKSEDSTTDLIPKSELLLIKQYFSFITYHQYQLGIFATLAFRL